jgi:hypothetical protein
MHGWLQKSVTGFFFEREMTIKNPDVEKTGGS